MSGLFPDPVAPGSVEPALLAKVSELHATVRQWLEDTAVAQRNDHIRANLPYADLMFAFGFATLGDAPSAEKLLGGAREALNEPIPPQRDAKNDPDPVVARSLRDVVLKAFEFRIEQALAGKPHSGRLSREVLDEREEIRRKAGTGPINNPYKLADHFIDRMREQSEIIDPHEKPDPYAHWSKYGDTLKTALAELHLIREREVLADRIRTLYRDGIPGKKLQEVQFFVLHEGLPLSACVGEAFTVELLNLVPAALAGGTGAASESPDLPKKQGELLQRALYLAGHFNRHDLVKKLVNDFTNLVHSKPEVIRYRLINVVAGQTLRSLRKLNLNEDIDQFLGRLRDEVFRGATTAELLNQHAAKPEMWGLVLQTLLNLASGWLTFGRKEQAESILVEARNELLKPNGSSLPPKEYTELARAYMVALGAGPAETGLNRMIELFREMPCTKVTNTWTTAKYYSRFHLNLVEDTVAAVCRMLAEPTPHVVGDSGP